MKGNVRIRRTTGLNGEAKLEVVDMSLQDDFEQFLRCLQEAGRGIDSYCFQLPMAGREDSVYRERVYCYELYHQLRNALPEDFPYKLHGEVDKKGHPVFREKCRSKVPDLIVHKPGQMDYNLVVIEVKPVTVRDDMKELREDVTKLICFLEDGAYYRALMFVYGDGKQSLPRVISEQVESLRKGRENRLLLVWHHGPGTEPAVVGRRVD